MGKIFNLSGLHLRILKTTGNVYNYNQNFILQAEKKCLMTLQLMGT